MSETEDGLVPQGSFGLGGDQYRLTTNGQLIVSRGRKEATPQEEFLWGVEIASLAAQLEKVGVPHLVYYHVARLNGQQVPRTLVINLSGLVDSTGDKKAGIHLPP